MEALWLILISYGATFLPPAQQWHKPTEKPVMGQNSGSSALYLVFIWIGHDYQNHWSMLKFGSEVPWSPSLNLYLKVFSGRPIVITWNCDPNISDGSATASGLIACSEFIPALIDTQGSAITVWPNVEPDISSHWPPASCKAVSWKCDGKQESLVPRNNSNCDNTQDPNKVCVELSKKSSRFVAISQRKGTHLQEIKIKS